MDGRATGGILRFIRDVPDPRASNVVHMLLDILVLAICGVICGADGWAEVEEFGRSKLAWFRTFLDLPHGVPSNDTFGRVFARLDPDAFERRFTAWVASVAGASGGRLVAVDGKAVRRSFEHAWDRSGMAGGGLALRPTWSARSWTPTAWCSARSRWAARATRSRRSRGCSPCWTWRGRP